MFHNIYQNMGRLLNKQVRQKVCIYLRNSRTNSCRSSYKNRVFHSFRSLPCRSVGALTLVYSRSSLSVSTVISFNIPLSYVFNLANLALLVGPTVSLQSVIVSMCILYLPSILEICFFFLWFLFKRPISYQLSLSDLLLAY